jgi:hypothetical protein
MGRFFYLGPGHNMNKLDSLQWMEVRVVAKKQMSQDASTQSKKMEDVEEHERTGLRADDENDDNTSIDRDGRIDVPRNTFW